MFYRGEERERAVARLEAEIAEVCGLLNATNARLVELIAEVLATDSWTGWGIRSPEHWVAWQCGVSSAHAHRLVVMARRLNELPRAQAAFTAGELSEDQVAVVTRHAPVAHDAEITEFARYATVAQLSRTLRSYPFPEPSPATEPASEPAPASEPVVERRDVSFRYTDTGRWRLWADLPADQGATVEASLTGHRDQLSRHHGNGDGGVGVTWADALLAMAAGQPVPVDRATVLVHLRTGPHHQPHAHLHQGPALPDAVRRYVSCDTRIQPVWETDGRPVSIGRTQRTVPRRTRTVIEDRDRGCRTPGCPRTRRLHIHHIVHWEDGGPTDTTNLIALCPQHHRAHHHGLLGITGNPDQPNSIQFTDQHGRPLKPNNPPTPPPNPPHQTAPQLGIQPGHYHHPTGEPLQTWSVTFNQPP